MDYRELSEEGVRFGNSIRFLEFQRYCLASQTRTRLPTYPRDAYIKVTLGAESDNHSVAVIVLKSENDREKLERGSCRDRNGPEISVTWCLAEF
jgi:hypothetical protein